MDFQRHLRCESSEGRPAPTPSGRADEPLYSNPNVGLSQTPSEPEPEAKQDFSIMDRLPDEILVHVLSFCQDGRTLLQDVPLVCRRWHALSRERAVWHKVDLVVKGRGDARVLLHAPGLRSLNVVLWTCSKSTMRCYSWEEARMTVKALQHSPAVGVRHLDARILEEHVPEGLHRAYSRAVVRTLHRNRSSLRSVKLSLSSHSCEDALDAVAGLRNLETLSMDLSDPSALNSYHGQLSGGALPTLKRFTFLCEPFQRRECAEENALFADVLRGADETLDEVTVLLEDGLDRTPLLSLPRLRVLRLVAVPARQHYDDEDMHDQGFEQDDAGELYSEATVDLQRTLTLCRSVPSLRWLRLNPDKAVPTSVRESWRDILVAFAAKAPKELKVCMGGSR